MELVRLGPRYSTSYTPDELIEGYSSLIWTERYDSIGEFEIKTPHVEKMRNLLPPDTLVSHLGTKEVMMVDTHEISTDENDIAVLTIKGQSLCDILNHRPIKSTYQLKRQLRKNYTATDGLSVLLWHAVANDSGKDVTRGDSNAKTAEQNDYNWTIYDKIPNVYVTDSIPVDGAAVTAWWWLEAGLLWPQFQYFLKHSDAGLRTIRPHPGSSGYSVAVSVALAGRGTVSKVYNSQINGIRFDLYKGVDRRISQSANSSVGFSLLNGDIDKTDYILANRDSKTYSEILSTLWIPEVYYPGESGLTGIRRRATTYDAGSPEVPTPPTKPAPIRSNASAAERKAYNTELDKYEDEYAAWLIKKRDVETRFRNSINSQAANELKAKRPISALSGEVSPYSPYLFGVHYDLGDLVTLQGDFGLTKDMRVAEYIRTEDENGETGIPGFVEI